MREIPLAADMGGRVAWFALGNGETHDELRCCLSLRAAGDLCAPERYAERGREDSAAAAAGRRRDFFAGLGIDEGRLAFCRQIHSRTVLWVADDYAARAADGLLSGGREAVLAVTVADCPPIYLADRETGAFGILHSGWKGTGILARALEMLQSSGRTTLGNLSVSVVRACTACTPLLSSFRRDGPSFFHMLALIGFIPRRRRVA